MTIAKKHEKQMAIAWMLIAGFQLIPIILNIISSDWLEVVLFFNVFLLSINLALKSLQAYMTAKVTESIIEEIESRMQWISVEDKLPSPIHEMHPYSEQVFVRYVERLDGKEHVHYSSDKLLCIGSIRHWSKYKTSTKHVTHWMPIPELPKEERK